MKLERKALLAIAAVKPSTPTEGLRVIYDIIPLHLHLKVCAMMAAIRQRDMLQLN